MNTVSRSLTVCQLLLLSVLAVCILPSAMAQPLDKDRILANLKYRLPTLREAEITLSELEPSDFTDFQQGSFTVNGQQTYRFLVSVESSRLLLLMTDPIDVGLTSEEIDELMIREEQQDREAAQNRHEILRRFAAGMPFRGSADAQITIYEFSDFQCPYCARAFTVMEELLDKYHEEVRFVFLHLPLPNHDWAKPAAIAADCAAEQDADAFWVLHDQYFTNQRAITRETMLSKSHEWLQGTGIDLDAWHACASDDASAANQGAALKVDVSVATAERFGVTGTPGFFVNGHFLNGAQPLEVFEELIVSIKGEAPIR